MRFSLFLHGCIVFVILGMPLFPQVPGTAPWTPVVNAGLLPVRVTVPQRFASAVSSQNMPLFLPEGWTASVFYAGSAVRKGRFLAWGPDSTLYVASMTPGTIVALPDRNRDGVADTAIIAASGFSNAHDVRFWRDTMFVCAEAGVFSLTDANKDGVFETRRTRVDKTVQPNQMGGNHTTRSLAIDSTNGFLFVSVGSRDNVARENDRATIERYTLDGGNRTIYATGVRNAVGIAIHPRTGALWANNNGSDRAGNDVPGEWVDIIRENGFYGYPFAWHHQTFFDFSNDPYRKLLPITAGDSAKVASMVPPAALITAHSAPMALEFSHDGMPHGFRRGAFMVLRGSWNRQPATGSKLVYFDFDNDDDTIANTVRDVCTGFMLDSMASPARRWGRPVGLALAADGSIYLTSDDITHVILKLTPPPFATSVNNASTHEPPRLYPNPTEHHVTIEWPYLHVVRDYSVVSTSGEVLLKGAMPSASSGSVTIDCSNLPPGRMFLHLSTDSGVAVHLPFVIQR